MSEATLEVAQPEFNELGEIEANVPHQSVSVAATIADFNRAESEYYARLNRPRRRRGRTWGRMSERGRAAHIDSCPNLCDVCREHRTGTTLNLQCGGCERVVDMPERGEQGSTAEFVCPVCGTSNHERIED